MEVSAHDCILSDAIKVCDDAFPDKRSRQELARDACLVDEEFDEKEVEVQRIDSDWVVLDPEELKLVPFKGVGRVEEDRTFATHAAAAAAGAAGLILVGPVAGAIAAAGTIGAYAEPGSFRSAVRWVREAEYQSITPPRSIAECKEAAEAFAGSAKQAIAVAKCTGRRVYSALSGIDVAERDQMIARLQVALAKSNGEAEEEKIRLASDLAATQKAHSDAAARLQEDMSDVEKQWREHSMWLNSQLEAAEQARAEEQQSLHHELEEARLAKDEETERLAKMLEVTKRTWTQDTERLTAELEHHRRERVAENLRLTSELDEAQKAQKAELLRLQEQVAEAERAKASEVEGCRQASVALEEAIRQSEEDSESRKCTICMMSIGKCCSCLVGMLLVAVGARRSYRFALSIESPFSRRSSG
jgi:hypothetical protein